MPSFQSFANACATLEPQSPDSDPSKGHNWQRGEMGTTLYDHILGPNQRSCTNDVLVQEGAYTAGSEHKGGANALFVDGHVRFIADKIEVSLWRALGTKEGGEPISNNF